MIKLEQLNELRNPSVEEEEAKQNKQGAIPCIALDSQVFKLVLFNCYKNMHYYFNDYDYNHATTKEYLE